MVSLRYIAGADGGLDKRKTTREDLAGERERESREEDIKRRWVYVVNDRCQKKELGARTTPQEASVRSGRKEMNLSTSRRCDAAQQSQTSRSNEAR